MKQRMIFSFMTVAFLLLAFYGSAHAITIRFEATDLTDTVPSEDLWQYTYRVSDFNFDANVGFSILFDPSLYRNLEDPPPVVNADWDILVLQPDPGVPDDGLYDALALVNGASLSDPFTLSFVWLGASGTTPGAQPFEVNRFDAQGNIVQQIASGQTQTSAIPEPGTLLLIGIGFISLTRMRNRYLNRFDIAYPTI